MLASILASSVTAHAETDVFIRTVGFALTGSDEADPKVIGDRSKCVFNHFIGYPATGALEIASPYRHEAAKALESAIRSMRPSFYFDLRCLDCRELTLKISEAASIANSVAISIS
jgi:hypothetical protein